MQQTCIKAKFTSKHAGVSAGQSLPLSTLMTPNIDTSFTVGFLPAALLLPSTQAHFFDGQCMALLHLSLPANSSHCRRSGRESISSATIIAVMEFLLSSASATRSGVAFAFFTAPPFPSDSFVLHASNHLPDHSLPHSSRQTPNKQPPKSCRHLSRSLSRPMFD